MKELDIQDSIPDEMKSLFTFDDNQFIDLSSISYPRRSQIIRENSTQDLVEIDEEDIENLKRKVDAGAEHLMSQLFFDNDHFYTFLDKARNKGIDVPVEAGIKRNHF